MRPRFLRGKEPFPDGLLVLRFAQGRFPRALLRDLRLDGRVRTKDDERAAVADWILALTRKGESR